MWGVGGWVCVWVGVGVQGKTRRGVKEWYNNDEKYTRGKGERGREGRRGMEGKGGEG